MKAPITKITSDSYARAFAEMLQEMASAVGRNATLNAKGLAKVCAEAEIRMTVTRHEHGVRIHLERA